jgi:peptide/nickel transport system substrate-binding protein
VKRVALLAAVLMALVASGGATAERQAANAVVFGLMTDAGGGFNTALACCNSLQAVQMGGIEAQRGAFIQNNRDVWMKDLVSAAKADARGVSYTIRPNAYWYWGGRKLPVTYHDFVYTLQQIDNPQNDVYGREGYANLDPTKFTHRGDRHVSFFWRRSGCSPDFPCGPFANWQYLFSSLYPSFALAGVDFNKIWTNCICGSDGKPVSDGPFYLASYTPGQGSVLKRNPYYYKQAKLAELDFKVITDPALLAEAMRSGQVDAIAPPFTTDLLALRGTPGVQVSLPPVFSLELLELREGSAPAGPSVTKGASNVLLRAPWLRQAIMLGLDRRAMINAVYGRGSGLEPVDSLLFFPGEEGYRRSFGRWSYSPAKALALLRRHCTGGPAVPDPATAKVWHCTGLPAAFRYTWTSTAPARTTIEQIAKANLRAIGITLTEQPLPTNLLFAPTGVPSGDFDLAQFANFTSGDPGDWNELYRCRGASNWTGYCSHSLDGLLTAATSTLEPEKRTLIFQRADAILATQVPVIPLFQKLDVLVHKRALLGIAPNPSVSTDFWNVEDWHWKR